MFDIDEKYMKMCINLAEKGKGKTLPNPMVGCIVLDRNGQMVSKGYHKKCGKNHAERDALLKLKNNEAYDGTLYVNLEPCSHYGKTPPCTDLIIESGIKRVVYGMKDVNPNVNGAEILKKAGIVVKGGILEEECKFLNRVFIKNITKRLPYVVIKTAVTADGKIATKTGSSKWITSSVSREEVYKMRQEFDCLMTSSNTVIADNPKMEHKFKCILDTNSRVPLSSNIFKQGEVYIATSKNTRINGGKIDLVALLSDLYERGVYTVFLECGGVLAGAMLKQNLIDEVYQFIAPKILNDNSGKSCFDGDCISDIAESRDFRIYDSKICGNDILIKMVRVYN